MNIITLSTHDTMDAAYTEYERLDQAYLRAFKRKPKVDLTLATSSMFTPSSARTKIEVYEVRCHYTAENESEALWFEAEASRAD